MSPRRHRSSRRRLLAATALVVLAVAALALPAAAAGGASVAGAQVTDTGTDADATFHVEDLQGQPVFQGQLVAITGLERGEILALESENDFQQVQANANGTALVDTSVFEPGDFAVRADASGHQGSFDLYSQSLDASFDLASTTGASTLVVDSNRVNFDAAVTATGLDAAVLDRAIEGGTVRNDALVLDVGDTPGEFRVDASELPEGEHRFVVEATDAGASDAATLSVARPQATVDEFRVVPEPTGDGRLLSVGASPEEYDVALEADGVAPADLARAVEGASLEDGRVVRSDVGPSEQFALNASALPRRSFELTGTLVGDAEASATTTVTPADVAVDVGNLSGGHTAWEGETLAIEGLDDGEVVSIEGIFASDEAVAEDGTAIFDTEGMDGDGLAVRTEARGQVGTVDVQQQLVEVSIERPPTHDPTSVDVELLSNRARYDVALEVEGASAQDLAAATDGGRVVDGEYVRSVEGSQTSFGLDLARLPEDPTVRAVVTDTGVAASASVDLPTQSVDRRFEIDDHARVWAGQRVELTGFGDTSIVEASTEGDDFEQLMADDGTVLFHPDELETGEWTFRSPGSDVQGTVVVTEQQLDLSVGSPRVGPDDETTVTVDSNRAGYELAFLAEDVAPADLAAAIEGARLVNGTVRAEVPENARTFEVNASTLAVNQHELHAYVVDAAANDSATIAVEPWIDVTGEFTVFGRLKLPASEDATVTAETHLEPGTTVHLRMNLPGEFRTGSGEVQSDGTVSIPVDLSGFAPGTQVQRVRLRSQDLETATNVPAELVAGGTATVENVEIAASELDGRTVWTGQWVRITGFASDETVELSADEERVRRSTDANGTLLVGTGRLGPGEYRVEGSESGSVGTLAVREQTLNASVDPDVTDGVATLTVDSNRVGYDVEFEAEGIDAADLAAAIEGAHVRDERVVATIDGTGRNLTVNASALPTGAHVIDASVVDAAASASTTLEVQAAGPCADAAAVTSIDGQTVCDVDGDGRHGDVNGDGEFGHADVQAFFAVQHRPTWKQPSLFDFNGNDRVGHGDVVALFQDVANQPLGVGSGGDGAGD